jgi:hypothetical protein
LRSFASLASWRIFISLSSVRFIEGLGRAGARARVFARFAARPERGGARG